MTPGALTPAEIREAVHASLAHDVLRPMPPDPGLTFVVNLVPRRRTFRKTAP